ncbi:MAG: lumazine-binding family protein [Rhizorhabdus sp.]|nr:lumazine-binding family protein [Rhizorhabdus sp.]
MSENIIPILHDLLMTYTRGADRADEAIMRSAFHDGATMETGFAATDIDTYVPAILQRTRSLYRTMSHYVSNERYEIADDHARGECYVTVFALTSGDAPEEVRSGGRYLDRFERREGVWKFVRRTYVHDWKTVRPAAMVPPPGSGIVGGFSPDDPSMAFWAAALNPTPD